MDCHPSLASSVRGPRRLVGVEMHREELTELLTKAFKKAALRLKADGHEYPWPEDLRARDIVRLLRERTRDVIANAYQEGDGP